MGTGCLSGRFMGTCLLLRLERGQIQWKSKSKSQVFEKCILNYSILGCLLHRPISLRYDFLLSHSRLNPTRSRRRPTLLRHPRLQQAPRIPSLDGRRNASLLLLRHLFWLPNRSGFLQQIPSEFYEGLYHSLCFQFGHFTSGGRGHFQCTGVHGP